MTSIALEWLNLIVRWIHVIAAIMWIGDSFLFVWLDSQLQPPRKPRAHEKPLMARLASAWFARHIGRLEEAAFPAGEGRLFKSAGFQPCSTALLK